MGFSKKISLCQFSCPPPKQKHETETETRNTKHETETETETRNTKPISDFPTICAHIRLPVCGKYKD